MSEFLPDDAATGALARRLAAALPESIGGLTLLLRGELGAGKSTFARALLRALGHKGPVPSPTYTLVEPYEVSVGPVYHIDLYRVSSEEELRYLGWAELDEGFRIVEWPDRAPGVAKDADLLLTLEYRDRGRQAELQGLSSTGRKILARMATSTEPVD
jgi:tRNA threonylcarbamoyladenosine biosynthesis protein TsaE